jgi:hypothetical protein
MTPLGFSKLEILGGNGKPAIDHFLGQPLVLQGRKSVNILMNKCSICLLPEHTFTHFFYPLVNKQFEPENHPFLMDTNLPTPTAGRVELLIYWRVNGILL